MENYCQDVAGQLLGIDLQVQVNFPSRYRKRQNANCTNTGFPPERAMCVQWFICRVRNALATVKQQIRLSSFLEQAVDSGFCK